MLLLLERLYDANACNAIATTPTECKRVACSGRITAAKKLWGEVGGQVGLAHHCLLPQGRHACEEL